MTTTEIITHIEQLQSRAERAEALLADERLKVENLQRDLREHERRQPVEVYSRKGIQITEGGKGLPPIGRLVIVAGGPAVWDGTRWMSHAHGTDVRPIQWPVRWWMPFPQENDAAELAARPAVSEETVQAICSWFRSGYYSPEYIHEKIRRHLLPATQEPVPIPDGVYWNESTNLFGCVASGCWVLPDTSFYKQWYPRRHEFPQSREEAERRGKPDEVMGLVDDTEKLSRHMIDGAAVLKRMEKLRVAILKEREAGR